MFWFLLSTCVVVALISQFSALNKRRKRSLKLEGLQASVNNMAGHAGAS
jgi:hypothetical protein